METITQPHKLSSDLQSLQFKSKVNVVEDPNMNSNISY